MRIGAIDIGTVTTRLLVADVENGRIVDVYRDLAIAHLGEGLYSSGSLSEQGMRRVTEVLDAYAQRCTELGCDVVRCVATAAVRKAANRAQFLERVVTTGLKLEVISGEEEAELAFMGATYQRATEGIVVVDPGGGSTEMILGSLDTQRTSSVELAISLPVGSRRLTEMFVKQDPPSEEELDAIRNYIRPLVNAFYENSQDSDITIGEVVAVAGTATTMVTILLAMSEYDSERVNNYQLSKEELMAVIHRLCTMSQDEREQLVGLEPQRASVIIAGALILEQVMEGMNVNTLTISDNDLLYGIILKREN